MDSRLQERVRRHIAAYCGVVPDRLGPLDVRLLHDADRQVYRLQPAASPIAFVLKTRSRGRALKEGDLDEHATDAEYDRLSEAWSAATRAEGTVTMPVPVASFPEHRAMLTTWCEGTELRRVYYAEAWKWPLSRRRLNGLFASCGDWLGRFHNATRRRKNAAWAAERRMYHVNRMIRQLADHPQNRLRENRLAELAESIRAGLLVSPDLDVALLHGNYTLRNVLVGANGAAAVDFEDTRTDAAALDAGQLVADIALSAYRPFIREGTRRELAASFLRAYGRHMTLEPERLQACALYHLLSAYYEVTLRTRRNLGSSLLAARQLDVFSRLLRRPQPGSV